MEMTSSSTSTSTAGEWDSLPPELHEQILRKVDTFTDLLTCRIINSPWKEVSESFLETRSLSIWTNWTPFATPRYGDPNNPYLPVMRQCPVRWGSYEHRMLNRELVWSHAALPFAGNPDVSSPFPTNSIRIEVDSSGRVSPSNAALMVRDLCVDWGHQLKALYLDELTTKLEVLVEILRPLVSIVGLTLNNVKLDGFHGKSKSKRRPLAVPPHPNLPPLPNLLHLKIFFSKKSMAQLFFNSYSNQLLSLETDIPIQPCSQSFSNLKQMKLFVDRKVLLETQLEPSSFPVLQNLSIIKDEWSIGWDKLLSIVDSLPPTLVHLHLDILISDEKTEVVMRKITNQTQEALRTFPLVKKLGLSYPGNQQQAERIGMWLLRRFPNVEVLDLTRCCKKEAVPPQRSEVGAIMVYLLSVGHEKSPGAAFPGVPNVGHKLQKIVVHKDGTNSKICELRRNT